MGYRGQGAGTSNLDIDPDNGSGLLGRFKFEGHGPSRAPRFLAEAGLQVQPVYLNHGAINFKEKL